MESEKKMRDRRTIFYTKDVGKAIQERLAIQDDIDDTNVEPSDDDIYDFSHIFEEYEDCVEIDNIDYLAGYAAHKTKKEFGKSGNCEETGAQQTSSRG
jgi:hypothetical protein